MTILLDATTGLCWAAVYIIAIIIGIRSKTYCIPWLAICCNLSWEISVVLDRCMNHSPLDSSFIYQILWLILDVGVLVTWLIRKNKNIGVQIAVLFVILAITLFSNLIGGFWKESVFLINLLMSALFLFKADTKVIDSISIAILKCVGTLAATILNGFIYANLIVVALGGFCFIADLCYICDVFAQRRSASAKITNLD